MRQHIGIAGAGLLGRLLAWQLASCGHGVTVFDPADGPQQRGAAGWTAAGMLSPWAELETGDATVAELGLRSIARWREIVPALPHPVDLRCHGSLLLAHRGDVGSAQRLLGLLRARMPQLQPQPQPHPQPQPQQPQLLHPLQPRALDAGALRELEPSVFGPAHAWLLEGEGQIDSVQAMHAMYAGAARRGVEWRWKHRVQTLAPGCIDGVRFDWVFDVRGVGARPDLPVRGVRGEIVTLHAPGVVLKRPLRLLHPRQRVYLVPRHGETILVGASEIESEDRSPISVRTLLGLLSAAHSVIPELAEARVVHSETNLRPALPDNLPCIETRTGLTRINGLFRHGWLIAPALVDDALDRAGLIPSAVQSMEAA